MYSNLTERKQRTKIGTSYSLWRDIILVVLQGSVSRLLLFNTFLCGLLLLMKGMDFASYADDNTLDIIIGDDIEQVVSTLKDISKANPERFHLVN